ncbi:alpha/beta hydrolase [Pontimicrobium sp. SW4]|uniref:Alpha/beta hydrolase n=1 Tax=Pontimicrobium sp. SW4 TaxID=3153519 RepID=A0AAU7BTE2_9FLAO
MNTFILFKNAKMHYNDYGKGDVVVLLHGFLESSTMWHNFIPQFSKNNRVVTIDLLGHGYSESIDNVHSMELMAEAVNEILSHLKIKKATFIGHSMGGYVALAYAKLFYSKVSGLCLMNSTYKDDDAELKLLRTRANKMVESNFKSMVQLSFINLFAPKSRIDHKESIKSALSEALKTSVNGYIAAQEGMRIRLDSKNIFEKLECKKLIIIGEKDTVIDGRILKEESNELLTEIVELPNGHMSHIEDKESFSYIIMHFIENL